jgi:prepilin signal peptidase PulO-like enzyme (type II secretory pathway)
MDVLVYCLFVAGGLAAGFGLSIFFRRMPSAWLLDYDETDVTQELLDSQKLRLWPDTVILMAADAVVFISGWHFLGTGLHLPAVLLAAQPLLLVVVADFKTRIIPDQFVAALLPCALLLWIADGIAIDPAWLTGLWQRLLGGLAGGAVLFLAGWIGEKIMHREAMGMGDVKLLAACGLMSGILSLPLLLVLSFFSAAFVALPMLIRRMRNPESSSDMAFGPYIAMAAMAVLIFSQPIARLWELYLSFTIYR